MMNNKKITKPKPRGRPQVSTLKRLTKSVTVKFSKPDYEKLRHRSINANCTLAEYIRDAAFDTRIVAKHSAEDATLIRNLTGMANNLNQITKLSHQTGFYRTKNILIELLAKLNDDSLKYRYIKMKGDASAEQIATLEEIFELNRDAQNIEQMREDVETYEEAVRKQAALAEQARLKEQAAREQESKAKSIKDRQQPKDKP